MNENEQKFENVAAEHYERKLFERACDAEEILREIASARASLDRAEAIARKLLRDFDTERGVI